MHTGVHNESILHLQKNEKQNFQLTLVIKLGSQPLQNLKIWNGSSAQIIGSLKSFVPFLIIYIHLMTFWTKAVLKKTEENFSLLRPCSKSFTGRHDSCRCKSVHRQYTASDASSIKARSHWRFLPRFGVRFLLRLSRRFHGDANSRRFQWWQRLYAPRTV